MENKNLGWVEIVLFFSSGVFFLNSFIWTIASRLNLDKSDDNIWAERALIAIVCLGFFGVIREIKKIKE